MLLYSFLYRLQFSLLSATLLANNEVVPMLDELKTVKTIQGLFAIFTIMLIMVIVYLNKRNSDSQKELLEHYKKELDYNRVTKNALANEKAQAITAYIDLQKSTSETNNEVREKANGKMHELLEKYNNGMNDIKILFNTILNKLS